MSVTGTARRIGATLAASAALVAGCVACSSSSNGTGKPAPGTGTTQAGVTTPPVVSTPSIPAPSLPVVSASPVNPPTAGGRFCKDFNPSAVVNMGNANDIGHLVKIFQKVAADAPAAIKPQAREVDRFLRDAQHGNVDPGKTTKIETDVRDITEYYFAHCR